MCVGSDINWENPYSELIDSICVPSLFVMSWTYQLLDLALNSPNRIVKVGSLFLILHETFSRDGRKCLNSSLILTWRAIQGNHIPFFSQWQCRMLNILEDLYYSFALQKSYHCNRCIHLFFWHYLDDLLLLWSIFQWTMHCHPLKLSNKDGFPIYREYQICELN